ncbi:hypothetical protein [Dendrosporobacter sp. 1207_IL3150]|uniref:hypothetical protein n=1 Tax=Dendrosporobacter sp. 1207_IL3150 TaxID=3084054 RepID=UPI002FD8D320
MNFDLSYIWQKTAFILTHYISIWILIAFFSSSAALWYLAGILEKHNSPRLKEIKLSRITAAAYVATAVGLWFISIILS